MTCSMSGNTCFSLKDDILEHRYLPDLLAPIHQKT